MALRNMNRDYGGFGFVGYMADAVELFQLNMGCGSKLKTLVKLIWHFGAWLVAELNLTKRLVQRLDHNKRLWVALTF
jgi:hypothetical protein